MDRGSALRFATSPSLQDIVHGCGSQQPGGRDPFLSFLQLSGSLRRAARKDPGAGAYSQEQTRYTLRTEQFG